MLIWKLNDDLNLFCFGQQLLGIKWIVSRGLTGNLQSRINKDRIRRLNINIEGLLWGICLA